MIETQFTSLYGLDMTVHRLNDEISLLYSPNGGVYQI